MAVDFKVCGGRRQMRREALPADVIDRFRREVFEVSIDCIEADGVAGCRVVEFILPVCNVEKFLGRRSGGVLRIVGCSVLVLSCGNTDPARSLVLGFPGEHAEVRLVRMFVLHAAGRIIQRFASHRVEQRLVRVVGVHAVAIGTRQTRL
jgi:hypothetical protein